MPRVTESYAAFNTAFANDPMRLWELTSTRFLLSLSQVAGVLDKELDPERRRFRNLSQFTISQGQDGSIQTPLTTNGPFALIEFTGALPRAGLMHDWEIVPDDFDTLKRLQDPEFDPGKKVLLSSSPGIQPPGQGPTNAPPDTVSWVTYSPKHIVLETDSVQPSIF